MTLPLSEGHEPANRPLMTPNDLTRYTPHSFPVFLGIRERQAKKVGICFKNRVLFSNSFNFL